MITHITEKCIAHLQIVTFQQINNIAQNHNYITRIITPIACVVDVIAETGKHLVIVIENVAVGIINSFGAAFFEVCSVQDAYKNLQKIKTSTITAIAMTILLPWNLSGNLRVNLPDPEHAHSCNREAKEQANLPMIVYNSTDLSPLQEAIGSGLLSALENISIRSILTSSVNEVALESISNSPKTTIIAELANDSRTSSLAIDMTSNSIINRGLICNVSNENITDNTAVRILLNRFTNLYYPMLEIKKIAKKTQYKTEKPIAQLQ